MAKILITGGAGYIGSHMTDLLRQRGHQVVVFDNLQNGFRDAVLDAKLVVGDLGDEKALERLFTEEQFEAVMHFASFIQVGESVSNPARYYQNNVVNTLNLLATMLKHKVKIIIFSSSAAVYGEPKYTPIDETHPKNPLNPYGRSKFIVEQILPDYDKAYGLRSISLRYFNAAGADPKGRLGERHDPESHLIPLVLQAASGRRDAITVYGEDYPTKDGTCIRDYIHIVDLCEAHLLALNKLLNGGNTNVYNLGNGNGFSILEVIETAKTITNKAIKIIKSSRRAGDPAVLVADATKAKKELGWQPKFPELSTIIEHAWQWEIKSSQ